MSGSATGLTYKGFNCVGDIYGSFTAANSLSGVVATHANSVAVTADFGIDAVDSTVHQNDVAGGYTESTTNVQATIGEAAKLGLSVMYRPLLDFLPANYQTNPGGTNALNGGYTPGEWRTYYDPANVADFFASYKTMILAQAAAAAAGGATLFCVGTEIDQLCGAAYKSYWTNAQGTGIIDEIRAQDPTLKLTYAADWDDDLSPWQYGGSGLSAVTGGQSLIDYYQGIAATLGKPLLFTEIGYANSSDAASSPSTPGYDENGNADNATADPTLQADLYRAFFQPWPQNGNGALVGAYLWNWEPGGAGISPFSVQGLAAQTQVTDGFAACFVAGTHIATPAGATTVEALRVGDRVTLARGGEAHVIWLGYRRIDCRRHRQPRAVHPVRVRAGAFAEGVPVRDLLLSPDHAVFLDGAMIPVRYLVNAATIVREPVDVVTYFHVELARHEVLLAEGLACESYLDTGNRRAFTNGGPAVMQHADFARDARARDGCAPHVSSGPRLAAARARLLVRAEALDHLRDDDAALRVFADGMPVALVAGVAALPAGTRVVRLRSRRFVPCEHGVNDDPRCLGVAVARLALDDAALPLDDPLLPEGWHAAEESLRWTDGDAAVMVQGARTLRLDVLRLGRYWADDAPCRAVRYGWCA